MQMKLILAAAALATGASLSGSALAQPQAVAPDMAVLDPDADGTVDLEEAQAAAKALWTKINNDGDNTLEMDELADRVTSDEFTAANPDGDTTLEEDEWMALVEARFNAANPDGDTTIESDEFGTPEGQKLLSILQ